MATRQFHFACGNISLCPHPPPSPVLLHEFIFAFQSLTLDLFEFSCLSHPRTPGLLLLSLWSLKDFTLSYLSVYGIIHDEEGPECLLPLKVRCLRTFMGVKSPRFVLCPYDHDNYA